MLIKSVYNGKKKCIKIEAFRRHCIPLTVQKAESNSVMFFVLSDSLKAFDPKIVKICSKNVRVCVSACRRCFLSFCGFGSVLSWLALFKASKHPLVSQESSFSPQRIRT